MTKRILAVFFHPHSDVTAVGGAEKRFIEILKVWGKKVPVTVIETEPSLLERCSINLQHYTLSSPLTLRKDKWLSIYIEWVSWILKACLHSFSFIPKRHNFGLILAPNNTLPNLLPAYFFHLILSRPICVIVHHIDTPSSTSTSVHATYQAYRTLGYNKKIACIKTFALQTMLFLLKHVDACITVSISTASSLTQQGVLRKKIFTSNNGVAFQYISRFQSEPKKRWDGVFVGRIAKEKGIFDLVSAWKEIVAVNKDAQLIIIGSGPDIRELETIIYKTRLERSILVKGRLDDKEMYTIMKMCRVFILPSKFEGWGLAIAEALASGLPAVCYDIPALKEVFGSCKSVFLVPVGDVDRLSQAILRVLSMDGNKLGEISKSYAKSFEWNKVAMDDLQAIRQVMS